MSQTTVLIALLCLTTSLLSAERLYDYKVLPARITFDAGELRSLIQAEKRNFRYHAARGKKNDAELLKRYGYIPSRGKKGLHPEVISSARIQRSSTN